MFGFLRRRRSGEELDDIRSHVLSERFSDFEQPVPFPAREKFQLQPLQQQAATEPEPAEPRFEARYGEGPAVALGTAEPQLGRAAERASRDYEILDRLNLIESQVAAIRSMTETINERLKNLETKLGRKY